MVAIALLDVWPVHLKGKLWTTLVYMTPSSFIYAVDSASRSRQQAAQAGTTFRKKDFGHYQAKSEALRRILGYGADIAASTTRRMSRSSAMDKTTADLIPVPAGLGNWDNSCYQNSVIQSLASLPAFDDFLEESVKALSPAHSRSTHEALRTIIGTLNNPDNQGKRFWIPAVLKSMNSWQQQDAQEYFSRVIDEVDKEILVSAKLKSTRAGFKKIPDTQGSSQVWPSNPFQGLLAQRVGCSKCGYTEGLSLLPFTCLTVNLGLRRQCSLEECLDDYTSLEDIEGVECIKCTVIRTKTSLEQVLSNMDAKEASDPDKDRASGPLSNLRKTVIERLITVGDICNEGEFSDPIIYKQLNISTKGRASTTKSKQVVVARPPKNLVIHVNRSIFDPAGYQRKNNARVRFPVRLDLTRWSLGSVPLETEGEAFERWNMDPKCTMLSEPDTQIAARSRMYELKAVISHYGLHEDGHYVAYRKPFWGEPTLGPQFSNEPKSQATWFGLSDHIVIPVPEEEVLAQDGVFMLFYEALPMQPTPSLVSIQPNIQSTMLSESSSQTDVKEKTKKQVELETSLTLEATVVTPVTSPRRKDKSEPPNHLDRTESPIPPPVAPITMTAGSLSPVLAKNRRSSNVSIHSPSFVTAS